MKIQDLIKEGSTDEEIADFDFSAWVKYHRAFSIYRGMKQAKRNHEVNVIVLMGPTGTGKSHWAAKEYPDAYWKQKSNWWDNYVAQKTIILDEFYGWLPFDTLLRICDKYPMQVEQKGGQTELVAENIIITTNQKPKQWYKNAYFPAFQRRVKYWKVLNAIDNQSTYTDYDEAEINFNNNTNYIF